MPPVSEHGGIIVWQQALVDTDIPDARTDHLHIGRVHQGFVVHAPGMHGIREGIAERIALPPVGPMHLHRPVELVQPAPLAGSDDAVTEHPLRPGHLVENPPRRGQAVIVEDHIVAVVRRRGADQAQFGVAVEIDLLHKIIELEAVHRDALAPPARDSSAWHIHRGRGCRSMHNRRARNGAGRRRSSGRPGAARIAAAAVTSVDSAAEAAKYSPKTLLSATNAVAMPAALARKLRRSIEFGTRICVGKGFRVPASAPSAHRSWAIGMNSPLVIMRVGDRQSRGRAVRADERAPLPTVQPHVLVPSTSCSPNQCVRARTSRPGRNRDVGGFWKCMTSRKPLAAFASVQVSSLIRPIYQLRKRLRRPPGAWAPGQP